MCTVTVFRGPERLLVTMNRDERRTRAEETPPRAVDAGSGAAWIGPADGHKGGTWFGASNRGVIACLLNAYAPEDLALLGRDDLPSRGAILPALLAQETSQLRAWLSDGLDPTPYPSFTLVLTTARWGLTYSWRLDGGVTRSEIPAGWFMVTSSLWRSVDVVGWRQRQFERWCGEGSPEVAGVPSFNLLEVPGRREWSPLMTRPISITRSVSQTEIRSGEPWLTVRYWRRDGEQPVEPARPTAIDRLPLAPGAIAP